MLAQYEKHAAKWKTAGNEKERALVFADTFDNFRSADCESVFKKRFMVRNGRDVIKAQKQIGTQLALIC